MLSTKPIIILLGVVVYSLIPLLAKESICYGTTSNGYLKYGVKLPHNGKNFVSYSRLADLLGRTYVHSKVKEIVLDSYKRLETLAPKKVFKYAECGFEQGGTFKPHKTHKNGLSVDFVVPVVDRQGNSIHLPTNPLNRFGYDIEFNTKGKYKGYQIDFEALALHLVTLDKSTKALGYQLWRVIFDPKLQPYLFRTQYGKYLKKHIRFSKRRSWVRHDEHYHVDFKIPCKPLLR